jgi:hypothetical protein
MKFISILLPAIALTAALTLFSPPAFSLPCSTATAICTKSAPAPLVGAGLAGFPVVLGFGVYWLVRRRRNHQD